MASEFSTLFDLVTSKGHFHTEILEDVKIKVLQLLRDKYPKTPIDAEIILDSDTGKIRVYSEDKDITPPKFAGLAESLAREHLISLLSSPASFSPSKPSTFHGPSLSQFSGFFRLVTNLFFWGYNLFFLFGSAIWLISLAFNPSRSLIHIFLSLVLLAIPASSIVLSITRKYYQSSGLLLRTFFLAEIPLMIITIIALSIPGDSNKFLWFVLFNLFLIPIVLLSSRFSHTSPKLYLLLSFFKTMTLIVWSYLCALFAFLVPKLISEIFHDIFGHIRFYNYNRYSYDYFSPVSTYDPGSIFAYLLQLGWGIIVFTFSLSLILLPFLILILIYRSFLRESLSKHHALFALVVITLAFIFSFSPKYTSEINSLQKLSSSSVSFSEKDTLARSLAPQKDKLKKIITHLNSSRDTYLLTKDTQVFDSEIYNQIFLTLAYPLVFPGPDSVYDLQRGYDLLFTTYKPSDSVTNKSVLLGYRKVSFVPTPSQALAEVTIEEEYENQTSAQQEVIYEFSLYPGSVITGLKLGPDLEFPGIIAPKGAAQKTYESQLAVRRDPALLEQIGSNTYRLRIYPVPGNRDFSTLKGKSQKVQFSYVTTTTENGFPLPVYTRLTNVFTSPATTYLLAHNNQLTKFDQTTKYLPSDFVTCSGTYYGDLKALPCLQNWPLQSKKIAVILDISLRNKGSNNIEELKKFAPKYQFDLYKFNTQLSDPLPASEAENITFWGESNLALVLPQITRAYDAVFIISSATTPLSRYDAYPFSLTTPVYFIHNKIPSYEIEFVSRVFQSGGLITNSFESAINHYLYALNLDSDQVLINKYFALKPTDDTSGPLDKLNQLAKLTQLAQSSPTNILNNITKLDELNALAKKAGIVTPYSSLIALVNDQQLAILRNFEGQYNRYDDQPIRENFANPPRGLNPIGRVVSPLMTNVELTNFKVAPPSNDISLGGGFGAVGVAPQGIYSPVSRGSGFSLLILLVLPILLALPVFLVYFLIKNLRRPKSR